LTGGGLAGGSWPGTIVSMMFSPLRISGPESAAPRSYSPKVKSINSVNSMASIGDARLQLVADTRMAGMPSAEELRRRRELKRLADEREWDAEVDAYYGDDG
jgi:hypothetical protein